MRLNWAALVVVFAGGILLLIAWEGTHRTVWAALTGQGQSPASTPGAPALGYVPPSPSDPCLGITDQTLLKLCRKNVSNQ